MLPLSYFLYVEKEVVIRWGWVFLIVLALSVLAAYVYKTTHFRILRRYIENVIRGLLLFSAVLAVFVTFAIAVSLFYESLKFFQQVPFFDFILGVRWSPNGVGYFGAVPLFAGTFLITAIAMSVAIPAGLMSAIYLSCYAHNRTRDIVKPLLELLAGIPTVVYGFFALVAVSPLLQELGGMMGLSIAAESALGVGLVMGFMIIPYIASLSDDVLTSVPKFLKEGSLALGATHSETIKKVIVPAAFPGIMASFLLAMSRAVGETMIVVMAAGYSARLTGNPFDPVTTVTVQIVSLLTGDQEFSSPKTLAAFALGLILLLITLTLNMIAMRIVRHYRDKYD
ncbi:MAG: phosphate ABC transporter permease subunit PstC [Alphaproteobacteria bacterium]|nr:phosphate ABC transporter permease subunit PstC [Alphaproteobacteria bacterium]